MKLKNFMIIIISLIGLLLIILILGRINLSFRFNKEVKELFSQAKSISGKAFSYKQLLDLPEPIQTYFKRVLKEGEPYISYARITHDGQFKTGLDKDWINIQGEQYATTEKPGFIWKGTTSMFVARDMYIADKGRLIVSLFSWYNVVNAKGEQYNQGELLRWRLTFLRSLTNTFPNKPR